MKISTRQEQHPFSPPHGNERDWNGEGIKGIKFVFFCSAQAKTPWSFQKAFSLIFLTIFARKKVLLKLERCNYAKLCRGKWDSFMHEGLRRRKWGRFCCFHGISLPDNQFDLKSRAEQSFWILLLYHQEIAVTWEAIHKPKTLLQFSDIFAALQQNLGIKSACLSVCYTFSVFCCKCLQLINWLAFIYFCLQEPSEVLAFYHHHYL